MEKAILEFLKLSKKPQSPNMMAYHLGQYIIDQAYLDLFKKLKSEGKIRRAGVICITKPGDELYEIN